MEDKWKSKVEEIPDTSAIEAEILEVQEDSTFILDEQKMYELQISPSNNSIYQRVILVTPVRRFSATLLLAHMDTPMVILYNLDLVQKYILPFSPTKEIVVYSDCGYVCINIVDDLINTNFLYLAQCVVLPKLNWAYPRSIDFFHSYWAYALPPEQPHFKVPYPKLCRIGFKYVPSPFLIFGPRSKECPVEKSLGDLDSRIKKFLSKSNGPGKHNDKHEYDGVQMHKAGESKSLVDNQPPKDDQKSHSQFVHDSLEAVPYSHFEMSTYSYPKMKHGKTYFPIFS